MMQRLVTSAMGAVFLLAAVACGGASTDTPERRSEKERPMTDGSREGAATAAPHALAPFALAKKTEPPVVEKRPIEIDQFGETRIDNYGWLRDENWQEVLRDPSVLKADVKHHLDAENAYYKTTTAHLNPLRQKLFNEMRGRLKDDETSLPVRHGDYAYLTRYQRGAEYPLYVRTPRDGGGEVTLFDGAAEAEKNKQAGFDFFNIAHVVHSPDHELVAYAIDNIGSEYFSIRIRNIDTGEEYPETVANTDGDIVWARDSASFFYIERDEHQRPKMVKRHILGQDPKSDRVVYEEPDNSFFLSVEKSQSGAFVFITSENSTTSEVRFLSADAPADAAPTLIEPRREGVLYYPEHRGDDFYVYTNADDAIDFKVMRTPVGAPSREHWVEWLPARRGVYVTDILPFADKFVRLETVAALPRIVVSDWSLENEKELTFDEAAYDLSLSPGYEFDTGVLRFTYESPSTPEETYDYDMGSGERVLLKQEEIPSGHNRDLYVVERKFFNTEDRRPIPVTILRLKDTPKDGSAPLLVYGYGSYGSSLRASFDPKILSLVDRGVIYAEAHVRGGADRGRQWYLDGKLDQKENTFKDLENVTASLQSSGYATRQKTVIYGGSAGGLLVGATVNRDPALFAGVIAAVPFVDVLNTISDATLPLTPPEWVEWGDPIRDETAFQTIKAYSPYENIKQGAAYPAILATAGLADYRVTYWEPAKWIARLRDEAAGGPFFMHTNMGAGHSGAAARYERLNDAADYYAFALEVFGATDQEPVAHTAE